MDEKTLHAILHLVTNRQDFLYRQALWVAERPIIPAQTWDVRAFVAAAHRDEKLCIPRQFLCELLWLCVAEVDANLAHYGLHFRMDALARIRSRRYSLCLLRVCELVEERGGHLRPSGVVYTSKDHLEQVVSCSCYWQQPVAQLVAGTVVVVPALGLMAYTFTLAAAAFTSYLLSSPDSSACSVVESLFGAAVQHEPPSIAGEQQPDWFSTFA